MVKRYCLDFIGWESQDGDCKDDECAPPPADYSLDVQVCLFGNDCTNGIR
jgi:hypothetical protein